MALRKLIDLVVTHKELALSQLFIGAIFFAMRSCEYLQSTHKEDSRRTRILRLRNIQFKKDGKVLAHDSPHIALSNLVIITFEFQKNNQRNRTVHMFKTDDGTLCPVKAWAYTVQRIRTTVPGSTEDTKVCAYVENGQVRFIDSTYARAKIRGVVDIIGSDILGFTKEDVGLHSIRSGGAMAMFLSGVTTLIIQRIGRWDSDAFMGYIREQVESFTVGVSSKMIENEQFHHLDQSHLQTTGTVDDGMNPTYGDRGEPILIKDVARFSNEALEYPKFVPD